MKKMYDIVTAVILALGLIISVAIFSNSLDKINKKSHIIIVKGNATIDRPIKEYNFTITVKTVAKEIDAVYNNLYNLEDIISGNIHYKYKKDDVNLSTILKKDGKTIQDYQVEASYTFNSNKLDEIKKIKEEVNKFTAQYPEMELGDINIVYADINQNALINQATKDAKNKAYSIVKENSKTLGPLVRIKQDKISIGESKATVNVTVTYEIN